MIFISCPYFLFEFVNIVIIVVVVGKKMLSDLKWLEIDWCVFDLWRVGDLFYPSL